MTQLVQRRCLVTSAVLHGMLLGALALLSAFSPKVPPPPSQPYILLVPTAENLSANASGGGTPPGAETPKPEAPRAAETPRVITPPPPVRPPPPVVTPRTPPPVERPTPRNRVETSDNIVRNPQATPQDVDPSRPTPKKTIEVSANKIRTPKDDRKKREQAAAEARQEAEREAAQREQDRNARLDWERRERERRESLSGVVKGLGSSLAPGTKIEIPGPGGGGAVVVNYADYVQSLFQAAWNRNRPATLAAKSAKSRVSLTIRRDGSFAYRVLAPARIAEVDAAIARILGQQRRLNPLPVELKSDDLEIIITFNLESSVSG